MKKFRIVALLLVMCLASSCFVGGTFAKYASEGSAEATASIAKWSFKVDSDDIVNSTDTNFTFDLLQTITENGSTTDTDLEVKSGVMAPGTQGKFKIELTNESDVDATYSVSLTEDSGNPDIAIEFSKDGSTWNATLDAITNTLDYKDGTKNTETVTIYWRWAYFTSAENDGKDLAAAGKSFKVTVTVSATQVD